MAGSVRVTLRSEDPPHGSLPVHGEPIRHPVVLEHKEPAPRVEAPQPAEQSKTVMTEPPASKDEQKALEADWKRPKPLPLPESHREAPKPPEHREDPERLALLHPSPVLPSHVPSLPEPHVGPPLHPALARVAIVIDDLGADVEMAKKFAALPFPVTFSILPYQRYTAEVAEVARVQNRQIMLHLPMEPQGYPKVNPGPGALLLSMNRTSLLKAVDAALKANPFAVGINNHMGSRFTERADLMQIVIQEVAHRGLFFVDSATSPNSVAAQLAQEFRVPHARRDVFLDHTQSEVAVKDQLEQLVRKARIQGTAVAIGHPHELTLRVLKGAADLFKKEGIAVVPVGDLLTRN